METQYFDQILGTWHLVASTFVCSSETLIQKTYIQPLFDCAKLRFRCQRARDLQSTYHKLLVHLEFTSPLLLEQTSKEFAEYFLTEASISTHDQQSCQQRLFNSTAPNLLAGRAALQNQTLLNLCPSTSIRLLHESLLVQSPVQCLSGASAVELFDQLLLPGSQIVKIDVCIPDKARQFSAL